ncbi:MAG: hypothetical protein ACKO5A_09680 [Actinomycetota bacterium]
MRPILRIIGATASIAVLATLGACGDETSAPTTTAGDTGSASGTVEVQLSEEFCAGLAQENPPSDWADTAPAELRQGAAAIVTFAETLSSQEENPNVATELADTLGADDVADQIRALATVAGEQCDSAGENIEILTQVATAATFASGESDQAYCDALRTEFADPSEQPTIDALVDLAPAEQREALEQLASSTGTGGVVAGLGAMWGLGLYAEARCDIDGAFGMMARMALASPLAPGARAKIEEAGDIGFASCSTLSTEGTLVQDLLGAPATFETDPFGSCVWEVTDAGDGPDLFAVSVSTTELYGVGLDSIRDMPSFTPVEGLGDEAFTVSGWSSSVGGGTEGFTLYVLKDGIVTTFSVAGVRDGVTDQLRAIATQALG